MKKILFSAWMLLSAMSIWAQAPERLGQMEWDEEELPRVSRRLSTPVHPMPTDVGVRKIIPRIPVILVEFDDFSFTRSKAEIDSMFNATHYAYTRQYPQESGMQTITAPGSIRCYFQDQSNGQYNPQFDIYGPIRVNKSCCAGFSNTNKVRDLVKEACTLANDQIDFSQYDADQDGQIDIVYVYYAGFGANDGGYIAPGLVSNPNELIWPHWSVTSGATYDGKTIRDYECANELDGYWTRSLSNIYPAGIGVAVHEFCHAMGLPDLYPTNGSTNTFRHLGLYDVMDYGCYSNEMHCPPSLSAYERWFLGWITPTLLHEPTNAELGYIGTTNQAYLITTDGQPLSGAHATTQPYYLLENRQKDKWDSGMIYGNDVLGHGMMITRVAYNPSAWSGNAVNNDRNNQRVGMILADGDYGINQGKWYGKATDLYPAGATEYTEIDGFPITQITEQNGVVRFKFMDGSTPTPTVTAPNHPKATKRLRNGQVLIEREEQTYTIWGQTMAPERRPSRVPSRRDPFTVVQPNGDSLTLMQVGDEWYHFRMTIDGWKVIENAKGYYCYALPVAGDEKALKPSRRKAHNAENRSRCEKRWLKKHGIQQFVEQ